MAGKVSPKDPTGRTVILTGVRYSFADSLKDQKPSKDGKMSHGCNLILERGHADFESNKAAVVAALQAAAREFKRPENWFMSLMEDDPKQCSFRKGEKFKTNAGEVYKGYAGNLIVVCKGPGGGARRPNVIKDRHKRDVAVADINDVVYNGTYGDAVVSFYGTDNGGTARLTCSIEAVRSYQEGERIGGGGITVGDDDFSDLGDDPSPFDSAPKPEAKPQSSVLDL